MIINFFLVPLFATLFFIAALYPLAVKMGFTDKPCHRKQHKKPTPLIGGFAIYSALLATVLLTINPLPHQSEFFVAATLLMLVGLLDDYRGIGVKVRLVAQMAAGLIMTQIAGIKVDTLGNLFGFGEIQLGDFATAFTVFAMVGGINAFNMIDGMDGLSGSLSLIAFATLAEMAWLAQDIAMYNFCLMFMAALIVFLAFNLRIAGRPNAKIFLGDSGSTFLGFAIFWLAISALHGEHSQMAPPMVLWITALPLMDSVCVMLRRLIKGRSPFQPDREHLHHIFHVAGFGINVTLAILVFVSLSLVMIGITVNHYFSDPDPILFGLFMLLFAVHSWMMGKAWTLIKITRYVLATGRPDRRIQHIIVADDRRSGDNRRFIPSGQEIKDFRKFRNGKVFRLRRLTEVFKHKHTA